MGYDNAPKAMHRVVPHLLILMLATAGCAPSPPSGEAPPADVPAAPPCPPAAEVVDSRMSLREAMDGLQVPAELAARMALLEVRHLGFDGRIHRGQLVCDRSVAGDLALVFERLLADSFPIERVVPIAAYGWDDERSMQANNTSCFNYRSVLDSGTLSEHAKGRAIDINPRYNPFVHPRKPVAPANGVYDPGLQGTITERSPAVRHFRHIGWKWGGGWRSAKDYQHFSWNGR